MLRRDADPGVRYLELQPVAIVPRGAPHREIYAATRGELGRVREEIELALTDLRLVGVHLSEIGREVDVERVRVLGDQGPDRRLHLRDERGDGEIFQEKLHLAGLDLREIKDVVDQA